MARGNSQLAFPPMEVRGTDASEAESPTVGPSVEIPDIPLHMAKMQLGSAIRETLEETGTQKKEVGDTSQVNRVCDGDVPNIIARVWMTPRRRAKFVKALAARSGMFDVRVSLHERKRRKVKR